MSVMLSRLEGIVLSVMTLRLHYYYYYYYYYYYALFCAIFMLLKNYTLSLS